MNTPDNPFAHSPHSFEQSHHSSFLGKDRDTKAHPIDAHFKNELDQASQVPTLSWEMLAPKLNNVQFTTKDLKDSQVSSNGALPVWWNRSLKRMAIGLSVAASVGIGLWLFWPGAEAPFFEQRLSNPSLSTVKPTEQSSPEGLDSTSALPTLPQMKQPTVWRPLVEQQMLPPVGNANVAIAPLQTQLGTADAHTAIQPTEQLIIKPSGIDRQAPLAPTGHPSNDLVAAEQVLNSQSLAAETSLPILPISPAEAPILPSSKPMDKAQPKRRPNKWLITVAYGLKTLPGIETGLQQDSERTVYQFRTALFQVRHTDYQ